MSDTQFSGNGTESTDRDMASDAKYLVRQKRQNLSGMDDLAVDIKDTDTVTYIETNETDPDDPLSLEQICVPVDGDNVSWIGLSS